MLNIKSIFLTISFCLLITLTYSQKVVIEEDNIKIEFIKSRKASKLITASNISIKSDEIKKVFVKIKSLNNKRQLVDPNKFSLVDANNGLRFRPTDIFYQNFTDWWGFGRVSKTKPKFKFNDYLFDKDVEDTFLNYNFEGIENISLPINFNTKRKPDIHIIHF